MKITSAQCAGCDETASYRDFKREMRGYGWNQREIDESWGEMDHQSRAHPNTKFEMRGGVESRHAARSRTTR